MTIEHMMKYMAGALAFLLVWIFRRVFTRLDDLDKQQQAERQRQDERYQGVLVSLTSIDLLKHSIEGLTQQVTNMNERLDKFMERTQ